MKYKSRTYRESSNKKRTLSVIGSLLLHVLLLWFMSFAPRHKQSKKPKSRGLRIVHIVSAKKHVSEKKTKGKGKKKEKGEKKQKAKSGELPKVVRRKAKKRTAKASSKKADREGKEAKKIAKKKFGKRGGSSRKLAKTSKKKMKLKNKKYVRLNKNLKSKQKKYTKKRSITKKKVKLKTHKTKKTVKTSSALPKKSVKLRKVDIKKKSIKKTDKKLKAAKTVKKRVLKKSASSKRKSKKRLKLKSRKHATLTKKALSKKKISPRKKKVTKKNISKKTESFSKWSKKSSKREKVKTVTERKSLAPKIKRAAKAYTELGSSTPVMRIDKRPTMKKAEASIPSPKAPEHKLLHDNRSKTSFKKFKDRKKIKIKSRANVPKKRRQVSVKLPKTTFSNIKSSASVSELTLSEPKRREVQSKKVKEKVRNVREFSETKTADAWVKKKPLPNTMPKPNPDESEPNKKIRMLAPEPAVSFSPEKERRKSVQGPSQVKKKTAEADNVALALSSKFEKQIEKKTEEDFTKIASVSRKASSASQDTRAYETASNPDTSTEIKESDSSSKKTDNPSLSDLDPLDDPTEEIGSKSMEDISREDVSPELHSGNESVVLSQYTPSGSTRQSKAISATSGEEWNKSAPTEEGASHGSMEKHSLSGNIGKTLAADTSLFDTTLSTPSVGFANKSQAEPFQWDRKGGEKGKKEVLEASESQRQGKSLQSMGQKEDFKSLAPTALFSSKDKKKAKISMGLNRPSGGLADKPVFKLNGVLGDSGFVSANVFINGVAQLATVGEDGTFTSVLPLKSGINEIQIYAVSPKGKRSEKRIQLWLPPGKFTNKKIYITKPENGVILRQNDLLVVKGSIEDKYLRNATLYVNDIPRTISVRDGEFEQEVAVEGFHTCKFRVEAKTSKGEIYSSHEVTVLISSDPRGIQMNPQLN